MEGKERDAERKGWEGPRAGGRRGRSRPVTGGPESWQGGRGEEKVGDAATIHGGAGPAEKPGQTRRDRTGQAGETDRVSGGRGCPSAQAARLLPQAPLARWSPSGPAPPLLPSQPLLSPLLCALITNRSSRPPGSLLATRPHSRPPCPPAPAWSLHRLSVRLSCDPSGRLWGPSASLWLPQIYLAPNLTPTPDPFGRPLPSAARPAPAQAPALICRP